ncbi:MULTISPECIES: gamma-glutamylcyclotransferase family protein [unclassified Nocardia]|uniref:gamma-glutamylcyclotransferase family protein n=1 Tax=unclassified Nocardia TaxID=2637762 RepID=UPI0034144505
MGSSKGFVVDNSGGTERLGRAIANGDQLFVYGTLQFPEVLGELIGRCPELVAAELTGWRVAALPGRVYPGLVPAAGGVARGVVLSGLDAGEWAVLDAFEDDEYELRRVQPGPATSAWTYVWTSVVAQDNWYAERFAAEHLGAFVARCAEWRRLL